MKTLFAPAALLLVALCLSGCFFPGRGGYYGGGYDHGWGGGGHEHGGPGPGPGYYHNGY